MCVHCACVSHISSSVNHLPFLLPSLCPLISLQPSLPLSPSLDVALAIGLDKTSVILDVTLDNPSLPKWQTLDTIQVTAELGCSLTSTRRGSPRGLLSELWPRRSRSVKFQSVGWTGGYEGHMCCPHNLPAG